MTKNTREVLCVSLYVLELGKLLQGAIQGVRMIGQRTVEEIKNVARDNGGNANTLLECRRTVQVALAQQAIIKLLANV